MSLVLAVLDFSHSIASTCFCQRQIFFFFFFILNTPTYVGMRSTHGARGRTLGAHWAHIGRTQCAPHIGWVLHWARPMFARTLGASAARTKGSGRRRRAHMVRGAAPPPAAASLEAPSSTLSALCCTCAAPSCTCAAPS